MVCMVSKMVTRQKKTDTYPKDVYRTPETLTPKDLYPLGTYPLGNAYQDAYPMPHTLVRPLANSFFYQGRGGGRKGLAPTRPRKERKKERGGKGKEHAPPPPLPQLAWCYRKV